MWDEIFFLLCRWIFSDIEGSKKIYGSMRASYVIPDDDCNEMVAIVSTRG